MRILHVYDMASVARTLADAQTALGHPAKVLARSTAVTEPPDEVLPATMDPVVSQLAILGHRGALRAADVIHIHGGIWRSHLVWSYLRARFPRKGFVVHLHGSETRTHKGLHHLAVADCILYSTPDLRPYVPGSRWLPVPHVAPHNVAPLPDGKPVLGHFPTNRAIKGTDAIVDAFRGLGPAERSNPEAGITRYSSERASLLVVEGVPHHRALEIMERCHTVIDQVNELGIYSAVSIEAMARGRAAVSSYEPSLYPEPLPVLRVTRDSLPSVLETIVTDPGARASAGKAGREYVRRVHDAKIIAEQSLRIYEEAVRRHGGFRA